MNRVTISIALLFVLVVALNYDDWFSEKPAVQKSNKMEAWQPNYQASGMRSVVFDENGNISQRIYATSMEHYDLLGFTLFKQPRFVVYTESQQNPWNIQADEATLKEEHTLQLDKNVIFQNTDQGGYVQKLTTDYVEFDIHSKSLSSDQLVHIDGKNYDIYGSGFSANLNSKQFELLNHVQSTFTPPAAN